MKKLHKLAAAVAVAAGIALSPQADATIQMKPNGAGDALLFPIYYGQFENLFTIANNSSNWIQGHLRFRGATWSTELRDFDVILSPGDVFVFRLADLDGDGQWEIDQSLDPRNFQYTGMLFTEDCQANGVSIPNCLNPSSLLEPTDLTGPTTKARLDAQRNAGHVEFIGEAVLNGMTHSIMESLISGNPGDVWGPYITSNGNMKGTNSWKWSDGANGFRICPAAGVGPGNTPYPCDRGLSDVPNVLTGTAFITYPGSVGALAYNADALTNFRTNTGGVGTHRVENYPNTAVAGGTSTAGADNSVIVHVDDASALPTFEYVYGFPGSGEDRRDELVTSFNNTWGPSLADGDDEPATIDKWDDRFRAKATKEPGTLYAYALQPTHVDSIDEVETAIRQAGQVFYAYYFDKGNTDRSPGAKNYSLSSWYIAYAPTKFFYAEDIDVAATTASWTNFINDRVKYLSTLGKSIGLEVWNHEEVPCSGRGTISPSNANPAILGEEVSIWNISWMKGLSVGDKNCPNFTNGRVVVNTNPATPSNPTYPFLLYTFEMGSDSKMYNMRAMQR